MGRPASLLFLGAIVLLVGALVVPATMGTSSGLKSGESVQGVAPNASSQGFLPVAARPQPTPSPTGNLLTNPGFEGGFSVQFAGIDTVKAADGWRAWYVCTDPHGGPGDPGTVNPCQPPCLPADADNCSVNCPNYCGGCSCESRGNCSDPGCYYGLPFAWPGAEGPYGNQDFVRRSGGNSYLFYTTNGRQFQAGAYQVVGGLTPGRPVEFKIWVRGHMCHAAREWQWGTCDGGRVTNQPGPYASLRWSVGIDPWGRDGPPQVGTLWGQETNNGEAFDGWYQYSVSTTVLGTAVTVYTRGRPVVGNLDDGDLFEIYVDDATLVMR